MRTLKHKNTLHKNNTHKKLSIRKKYKRSIYKKYASKKKSRMVIKKSYKKKPIKYNDKYGGIYSGIYSGAYKSDKSDKSSLNKRIHKTNKMDMNIGIINKPLFKRKSNITQVNKIIKNYKPINLEGGYNNMLNSNYNKGSIKKYRLVSSPLNYKNDTIKQNGGGIASFALKMFDAFGAKANWKWAHKERFRQILNDLEKYKKDTGKQIDAIKANAETIKSFATSRAQAITDLLTNTRLSITLDIYVSKNTSVQDIKTPLGQSFSIQRNTTKEKQLKLESDIKVADKERTRLLPKYKKFQESLIKASSKHADILKKYNKLSEFMAEIELKTNEYRILMKQTDLKKLDSDQQKVIKDYKKNEVLYTKIASLSKNALDSINKELEQITKYQREAQFFEEQFESTEKSKTSKLSKTMDKWKTLWTNFYDSLEKCIKINNDNINKCKEIIRISNDQIHLIAAIPTVKENTDLKDRFNNMLNNIGVVVNLLTEFDNEFTNIKREFLQITPAIRILINVGTVSSCVKTIFSNAYSWLEFTNNVISQANKITSFHDAAGGGRKYNSYKYNDYDNGNCNGNGNNIYGIINQSGGGVADFKLPDYTKAIDQQMKDFDKELTNICGVKVDDTGKKTEIENYLKERVKYCTDADAIIDNIKKTIDEYINIYKSNYTDVQKLISHIKTGFNEYENYIKSLPTPPASGGKKSVASPSINEYNQTCNWFKNIQNILDDLFKSYLKLIYTIMLDTNINSDVEKKDIIDNLNENTKNINIILIGIKSVLYQFLSKTNPIIKTFTTAEIDDHIDRIINKGLIDIYNYVSKLLPEHMKIHTVTKQILDILHDIPECKTKAIEIAKKVTEEEEEKKALAAYNSSTLPFQSLGTTISSDGTRQTVQFGKNIPTGATSLGKDYLSLLITPDDTRIYDNMKQLATIFQSLVHQPTGLLVKFIREIVELDKFTLELRTIETDIQSVTLAKDKELTANLTWLTEKYKAEVLKEEPVHTGSYNNMLAINNQLDSVTPKSAGIMSASTSFSANIPPKATGVQGSMLDFLQNVHMSNVGDSNKINDFVRTKYKDIAQSLASNSVDVLNKLEIEYDNFVNKYGSSVKTHTTMTNLLTHVVARNIPPNDISTLEHPLGVTPSKFLMKLDDLCVKYSNGKHIFELLAPKKENQGQKQGQKQQGQQQGQQQDKHKKSRKKHH